MKYFVWCTSDNKDWNRVLLLSNSSRINIENWKKYSMLHNLNCDEIGYKMSYIWMQKETGLIIKQTMLWKQYWQSTEWYAS